MKTGDKVKIVKSCLPFYEDGDTAVLERCDEDGDWWATMASGFNQSYEMCIGVAGEHFVVLD